jgi:hypothetical protein
LRCHHLLLVCRSDRRQEASRLCAATTTGCRDDRQLAKTSAPAHHAGLHITAG